MPQDFSFILEILHYSPKVPHVLPKPSQMLVLVTSTVTSCCISLVRVLEDCQLQKLPSEWRASEEIERPAWVGGREEEGRREGGGQGKEVGRGREEGGGGGGEGSSGEGGDRGREEGREGREEGGGGGEGGEQEEGERDKKRLVRC